MAQLSKEQLGGDAAKRERGKTGSDDKGRI